MLRSPPCVKSSRAYEKATQGAATLQLPSIGASEPLSSKRLLEENQVLRKKTEAGAARSDPHRLQSFASQVDIPHWASQVRLMAQEVEEVLSNNCSGLLVLLSSALQGEYQKQESSLDSGPCCVGHAHFNPPALT